MQDELQLPEAQTMHTPQPSQTYRVQFGPEVLDPLCHGLGHAIFRIALAQEPSVQSTGLPVSTIGSSGSTSRPSLGLVAGKHSWSIAYGARGCYCHATTHLDSLEIHAMPQHTQVCSILLLSQEDLCCRGSGWLTCADDLCPGY